MNKPTKPNITIPEAFAVDGIKTDFTSDKLQNGFDRLNPDVLAGDNLNKFIDDTYKGLNYAMAAADAINLIEQGEVLTVNDNNELISESITDKFVSKTGDTMSGALTVPMMHIDNSTIVETSTGVLSINGSNGVYLKYSYVNGTSGYNIWTNGYCEQWGHTFEENATITFLKRFINTNYQVYITPNGTPNRANISPCIVSKSNIGANIYIDSNSGENGGDWKASGYLASGQY